MMTDMKHSAVQQLVTSMVGAERASLPDALSAGLTH